MAGCAGAWRRRLKRPLEPDQPRRLSAISRRKASTSPPRPRATSERGVSPSSSTMGVARYQAITANGSGSTRAAAWNTAVTSSLSGQVPRRRERFGGRQGTIRRAGFAGMEGTRWRSRHGGGYRRARRMEWFNLVPATAGSGSRSACSRLRRSGDRPRGRCGRSGIPPASSGCRRPPRCGSGCPAPRGR